MNKLLLVFALLISSCAGSKYFRKLDKEEKRAIKDSRKWINVSKDEAHVLIMTNKGNMVVKLYNQTPLHRDNFLSKVSAGFYDSLLFHRVINRFMIQGGDPESKKATCLLYTSPSPRD